MFQTELLYSVFSSGWHLQSHTAHIVLQVDPVCNVKKIKKKK
jgi:hypothetical protein